jgi:hypothetical protein
MQRSWPSLWCFVDSLHARAHVGVELELAFAPGSRRGRIVKGREAVRNLKLDRWVATFSYALG